MDCVTTERRGRVAIVRLDRGDGRIEGAADPRSDGMAAGW